MTNATKRSTYKAKFHRLAGYRAARRNSRNGAVYVLFDGRETDLDVEGGRWITSCEKHSTLCNHASRSTALAQLPRGSWCEDCVNETE